MGDTEEFLASVLPRLTAADTALHNGDAAPRKALWSTQEPLTLFGAAMMTTGWPEIEATFDRLATRFSDCTSFEIEVVAAEASGDLAYLVAFEHTTASIGGDPPAPYSLRVTTIFRREAGAWKVVHRHADPLPDGASTRNRLSALRSSDAGESRGSSWRRDRAPAPGSHHASAPLVVRWNSEAGSLCHPDVLARRVSSGPAVHR